MLEDIDRRGVPLEQDHWRPQPRYNRPGTTGKVDTMGIREPAARRTLRHSSDSERTTADRSAEYPISNTQFPMSKFPIPSFPDRCLLALS
jgi:hypothetical protein